MTMRCNVFRTRMRIFLQQFALVYCHHPYINTITIQTNITNWIHVTININVVTVVLLPSGKPHCFGGPNCLQQRRRRRRRSCMYRAALAARELHCTALQRGGGSRPPTNMGHNVLCCSQQPPPPPTRTNAQSLIPSTIVFIQAQYS